MLAGAIGNEDIDIDALTKVLGGAERVGPLALPEIEALTTLLTETKEDGPSLLLAELIDEIIADDSVDKLAEMPAKDEEAKELGDAVSREDPEGFVSIEAMKAYTLKQKKQVNWRCSKLRSKFEHSRADPDPKAY